MKSLTVVAAAAVALSPALSAAFPVHVDPGAYAGRYIVNGGFADTSGPTTIDLAPGTYTLDDGNEIGGTAANPIEGSSFTFDVDAAGHVTSHNLAAAVGSGDTLTLNNATIHIAASGYPYPYYTSGSTFPTTTGSADLVVIPGLSFTIDDGAFLSGSDFVYDVDAAGGVSCNTPAASCSGSTIALQTASAAIDPGSYSFSWGITVAPHTLYTGPRTFTLIPGLAYAIDDGNFIGGSAFAFQANADSTVTVLTPGPATGGASLTFATFPLHVDPGGYPGYYRLAAVAGPPPGNGWFTGAADVSLIAGLTFAVNLDDGQGVVIQPQSGVTGTGSGVSSGGGTVPSTWTVTDSGQSYTFRFGQGSTLVTFSTVTSGGTTTLTTSSTGTPPPEGFKLGNPPVYYDISTTAQYSGQVTVCINYSGVQYGNIANLRLFHLEGGSWADRTSSLDTTTSTICASVSSLSPFLIAEPGFAVAIDVRPAAINLGSRGTVSAVVYGSAGLDAGQIDPATVKLAGAPVRATGGGLQTSLSDVNGDGLRDLILHFSISALRVAPSDTQAILTGKTFAGVPIRGSAPITIVR